MLAVRVLLVCALLLVRMERVHGMYGTCNAENVRENGRERGGKREGGREPSTQTNLLKHTYALTYTDMQ